MLVSGPLAHLVPWVRCLMCLPTPALQDLHQCLQPSPMDYHPSHPQLDTLISFPGEAGSGTAWS